MFSLPAQISNSHDIFIKRKCFVITGSNHGKTENRTSRFVYFLDTSMGKSIQKITVSLNA